MANPNNNKRQLERLPFVVVFFLISPIGQISRIRLISQII